MWLYLYNSKKINQIMNEKYKLIYPIRINNFSINQDKTNVLFWVLDKP